MAIKYYSNPEKGMVIGVLNGTSMDAANKISKMMRDTAFCAWHEKYRMPDTFKAYAKVYGGDKFDEEVGKEIVKKKLMKRYYKSFDSRIDAFRADVINLNTKIFENPDEFTS